MSVKQLADTTTNQILTAIENNMNDPKSISKIIESALLKVMSETRAGSVEVVNVCCSADQDLAHKIAHELHQKENALIANLMTLR